MNEAVACPQCKGHKTVKAVVTRPAGRWAHETRDSYSYYDTCPSCDGAGWMSAAHAAATRSAKRWMLIGCGLLTLGAVVLIFVLMFLAALLL